jgi:hypothetical protein
MRKRGDAWTEAEAEALRAMASLGITMVEAARRLHRDHSTVLRHASQLGRTWARRPSAATSRSERAVNPYAWTQADDRWLLALADAEWTQGMAANEMDRPHQTVWRHSKMLGIRWPPGNRSRKGVPVEHPS